MFKRFRRKEEGSTTLIMYIVLFPLFIAVFGYGIDTAIATYTRDTLQGSLDAATQSAVAMATNPTTGSANGTVSIRPESQTMAYVKDLYDMNRKGKVPQLLSCYSQVGLGAEAGYTSVTPAGSLINTNPSGKCYQMSAPKITYTGAGNRTKNLEITVVEYSRNAFIGMFIPELQYQKYTITSKATITTANE